MTSEEIIQRLLDEKKITVKEAMIILKDLAKIGLQQVLPEKIEKMIFPVPEPGQTIAPTPPYDVVVMYGVQTNPFTWSDTINTNTDTIAESSSTFSDVVAKMKNDNNYE